MEDNHLRELAEEIVYGDNITYKNSNFPGEAKEIMHELLVHQVELEMQNSELLEARSQLEASEEKYKKLFQLAPLSYVAIDKNGKIIEWNNIFEQMVNNTEPYLKDKPFVLYIEPESHEQFYMHLRQVFDSNDVKACKLKLRNRRRSFTALMTSQRVGCHDNLEGDCFCLTAIEDIDAAEQINNNLKLAKIEAEKASQAKSMFLANMSHEIRTPLNGIIGMNQLLLMENIDDRVMEMLIMQQKASENLLHIVEDVLDYSKIEAGKMEIRHSTINVKKLINDVIGIYSAIAEQKNIYLRYTIGENTPEYIYSDNMRIMQILSNLIGNAIKFTSSGGVDILIKKSFIDMKQSFITFEVSDTGIGIHESLHDKLFKEFSQIDNSYTKQYKGTGLGLALCKKLVDLLNGSISFTSQEGVGSKFCVNIPLSIIHEEQLHNKMWNQNRMENNEEFQNKEILLVEDDPINSLVIERFLSKKGFLVITASNGMEGIELFSKSKFALVLMDIQMPEMDGITAMRAIKNMQGNNGKMPPVIALTAYAMENEREKFMKSGFDDYISKPVDFDLLTSKINSFLTSNE